MLQGKRSYNVGIVDGSFGLNPTNKVTGTLVTARTAKSEKVYILSELFADDSLCSAPIVCGNEASLLENLGGASDICNNAGKLFISIEYVKKLDARVVSALESYEVCRVGIAPHLGGSVIVMNSSAHTDSGSAELV